MLNPEIVTALTNLLGPQGMLTGQDVRSRSAGIWGPPRQLLAEVLVRPDCTADVSRVLEICHAAGQPVVTHGGLTGVVEGADARPTDVVLSLERMRSVEDIDPVQRVMSVQAGTSLETVQREAESAGLLFPLDLGARGSATVGGNAATNAGGNQVLRYGMMRNLVLGLEAVLADGTVVSSMNQVLKNNAGYDLKQLFIGSEGTLGVITRLVLRLQQKPLSQETALVAAQSFDGIARLLGFLDNALGGDLNSFELMWQDFYGYIAGLSSHRMPLEPTYGYYALVEAWGSDPVRDVDRFRDALAKAMEDGLITDAAIAKSRTERDRIWGIRDDVVQLLELRPMFLFDVSMPMRHMEDYLARVRRQITERWAGGNMYVFGHLGDGNLHLAINAGPEDGSERRSVEEIVYAPLAPIGGSVSGEHGIGLEKKPFLSYCRSPEEIALMRKLKASLDPKGILNPGKIFD